MSINMYMYVCIWTYMYRVKTGCIYMTLYLDIHVQMYMYIMKTGGVSLPVRSEERTSQTAHTPASSSAPPPVAPRAPARPTR